jgi:hypothetical protein
VKVQNQKRNCITRKVLFVLLLIESRQSFHYHRGD